MGIGSYFRDIGRAVLGRPQQPAQDPPPADPKHGTPLQRAFVTAHVPGWQTSDHLNELEHFNSWPYVATHTIGKQWGNAGWTVYDGPKPGVVGKGLVRKSISPDAPAEDRIPRPTHPFAKLMKRPNPIKSGQAFLYQVGCQVAITGGYVLWEVRNELGFPIEFWVLPRGWLTWQLPTAQYPMGLWRVYPARRGGLWTSAVSPYVNGFWLDVRDTIVGGWPDPLAPGEYRSPYDACAQILDITEKADLATWAALVNAPRPGMILNLDPTAQLTDEQFQQMEQKIKQEKAGAHNAGNVMLLQGVTKQDLGTPLSDLNSVEVRKQNLEFVLGTQGVPLVATGMRTDVGSYAGDAATINSFIELNIQPGLTMFAGDMTHRGQRYWGEDFIAELNAKRYDDPTLDLQQADAIKDAVKSGGATWNEWRAKVKLPPMEGLDEIQQPAPPPGAVGPDGQPMPGGDMGDAEGFPSVTDDDLGDDVDLTPELGDDQRTGFKRPDLQAAGGRGFSRNGSH